MVSCNIGTNRAAANSAEKSGCMALWCLRNRIRTNDALSASTNPYITSPGIKGYAESEGVSSECASRPDDQWDEARQIVEFVVMLHLLTAVRLIHQQMVAMFQAAQ
jgi:hypothetical protein